MFNRAIAAQASSLVLFDGHLLIDSEAELIEVPQAAIAALRPALLVHVEAEPTLIAARRHSDTSRKRPACDIDTLAAQQAHSRDLCESNGRPLSIPVQVVGSGDVDGLVAISQSANSPTHIPTHNHAST